MNILVTLNSGLGADTGPNFNLTANVGSVTPSTATKVELLAGKFVDVDPSATQITVTSVGTCTTSIVLNIVGQTTTTTTSAASSFSLGYDVSNFFAACTDYGVSPTTVYSTTGATLAPGLVLYSNSSLSAFAVDGFYSNGTNWWRVNFGEGVIVSTGSCTTTTSTTSTTSTSTSTSTTSTTSTSTTTTLAPVVVNLGYDATVGWQACYATQSPYYISGESTLQNGTFIYTDSTLSATPADGYYSNGANYWNVISGELFDETPCPTTSTTSTTSTSTSTTSTTSTSTSTSTTSTSSTTSTTTEPPTTTSTSTSTTTEPPTSTTTSTSSTTSTTTIPLPPGETSTTTTSTTEPPTTTTSTSTSTSTSTTTEPPTTTTTTTEVVPSLIIYYKDIDLEGWSDSGTACSSTAPLDAVVYFNSPGPVDWNDAFNGGYTVYGSATRTFGWSGVAGNRWYKSVSAGNTGVVFEITNGVINSLTSCVGTTTTTTTAAPQCTYDGLTVVCDSTTTTTTGAPTTTTTTEAATTTTTSATQLLVYAKYINSNGNLQYQINSGPIEQFGSLTTDCSYITTLAVNVGDEIVFSDANTKVVASSTTVCPDGPGGFGCTVGYSVLTSGTQSVYVTIDGSSSC